MQNITTTQKEHLYEGGHVGVTVTGETLDGAPIALTEDDIIEGSFSIERNWTSGSTIEIGCAETSELIFELDNADGRWSDIRWEGTRLTVVLDIDGEPLQAGIFTVDEPPRKLTTMQIRALDDMAKFNRLYDSTCPYPATLLQILQDACSKCGVTLYTQAFDNDSYLVTERPEGDDITYHHVVAWVAELAGCNAWIDHLARLRLSWYGENQPETPAMEFTRASTAYHPDTGEEIPEDTPIFMPFAGDKQGLLVEEGTENLLTEDRSSFETSSRWSGLPRHVHAKSGEWAKHGSCSSKLTKSVSGIGAFRQSADISGSPVGTDWFVSAVVFVPPGSAYVGSGIKIAVAFHGGAKAGSFIAGLKTCVLNEGENYIWTTGKQDYADRTEAGIYVEELVGIALNEVIYVDNIMVAQAPYSLSWHLGGQTRANPTTLLTLPEALPAEFGIGLSAKMLHAHDAADRTFWQAGDYRCYFDAADNKLKITNGVVEAETAAVSWDADDYVGVYAGRQGGKLFIQAKIAGVVGDKAEIAGDAADSGTELYVGSRADGSESVNAVLADFVLHDSSDIDPEGYLAGVPDDADGGGES